MPTKKRAILSAPRIGASAAGSLAAAVAVEDRVVGQELHQAIQFPGRARLQKCVGQPLGLGGVRLESGAPVVESAARPG